MNNKNEGLIAGFVLGDVLGTPFRYSRKRKFFGIIEPIKTKSTFVIGKCSPTLYRILGTNGRGKVSQTELRAWECVSKKNIDALHTLAKDLKLKTDFPSFEDAMAYAVKSRCDSSERASIIGAIVGHTIGLDAMQKEMNTSANLEIVKDMITSASSACTC